MSNDEENPAFDVRDSAAAIEMLLPAAVPERIPAAAAAERCHCGVVHARSGTLNCGISRYPGATTRTERTPRR